MGADTDPTITPDMVRAVIGCGPARAERIAAYTNQRLAGLLPTDARREASIDYGEAYFYEKCLTALCSHFHLTAPRKAQATYEFLDRLPRAGLSGAHQTHHVQGGRTDPACPLCKPESGDQR